MDSMSLNRQLRPTSRRLHERNGPNDNTSWNGTNQSGVSGLKTDFRRKSNCSSRLTKHDKPSRVAASLSTADRTEIFDRLHVVDLRGVRFGVTQHRLRVLSRPAAPDQDKRIRFC